VFASSPIIRKFLSASCYGKFVCYDFDARIYPAGNMIDRRDLLTTVDATTLLTAIPSPARETEPIVSDPRTRISDTIRREHSAQVNLEPGNLTIFAITAEQHS
jgi:hypothetical protein